MLVSSTEVKQFILDLIQQANYPGSMLEFVVGVKQEVKEAKVAEPHDLGGIDQTASDRMLSHRGV
jgi:hypothetical protein